MRNKRGVGGRKTKITQGSHFPVKVERILHRHPITIVVATNKNDANEMIPIVTIGPPN